VVLNGMVVLFDGLLGSSGSVVSGASVVVRYFGDGGGVGRHSPL
jgi:hypothetical protein